MAVESQRTEEGGLAAAAPMFDHVPAPAGELWNWAEATPEPPASAEFELTVTALPRTIAAEAGAVREPVGLVMSRVTVNVPVRVRFCPLVTVTVCAPEAAVDALQ